MPPCLTRVRTCFADAMHARDDVVIVVAGRMVEELHVRDAHRVHDAIAELSRTLSSAAV